MTDPFFQLRMVSAGFPSPGDDYLDPELDYNQLLKRNPAATFSRRVVGDCMADAYIPHGSIVVVDRSIKPPNNSIVVATLDGETVIKHLVRTMDGIFLLPANSKFKSVKIGDGMDFAVWGTVTHAVIDLLKPRI